MKETGIIMSGNHPKLILDGIKTMTRRTWGLERINQVPSSWYQSEFRDGLWHFQQRHTNDKVAIKCSYGGIGDLLWVRETYSMDWWQAASMIVYRADLEEEDIKRGKLYDPIMKEDTKLYWKSPLFMHYWKSRITLEITELRAERLQEINYPDLIAEGIVHRFENPIPDLYGVVYKDNRQTFEKLWDFLNAKRGYGWEANPWVWVIGFRVIK